MTKIKAGDVVIVDFPGVMETKRRPAVIISSDTYHATRPDVIIDLITSQTAAAIAPSTANLRGFAKRRVKLSGKGPSSFMSF